MFVCKKVIDPLTEHGLINQDNNQALQINPVQQGPSWPISIP
jgi:hypothetical protein